MVLVSASLLQEPTTGVSNLMEASTCNHLPICTPFSSVLSRSRRKLWRYLRSAIQGFRGSPDKSQLMQIAPLLAKDLRRSWRLA